MSFGAGPSERIGKWGLVSTNFCISANPVSIRGFRLCQPPKVIPPNFLTFRRPCGVQCCLFRFGFLVRGVVTYFWQEKRHVLNPYYFYKPDSYWQRNGPFLRIIWSFKWFLRTSELHCTAAAALLFLSALAKPACRQPWVHSYSSCTLPVKKV